jgi:hypothetical protein
MATEFDCAADCTYDTVRGIGMARPGQERKALSRIGSLLHYWFLNAKRLFHMLITLAFMLLTVLVGAQALSEWLEYRKTPDAGLLYFDLYGGLTVFLAILCLYSYVKARSVR